jgi:hypothetical protein
MSGLSAQCQRMKSSRTPQCRRTKPHPNLHRARGNRAGMGKRRVHLYLALLVGRTAKRRRAEFLRVATGSSSSSSSQHTVPPDSIQRAMVGMIRWPLTRMEMVGSIV